MGCGGSKEEAYGSSEPQLSPEEKKKKEEESEAEKSLAEEREQKRKEFEAYAKKEAERRLQWEIKMAAEEEEAREAEEAADEELIRNGATICMQAAVRGMMKRAQLAKSEKPALVDVIAKTYTRRKKEPKIENVPLTKAHRSASFEKKARSASRVARAKSGNLAKLSPSGRAFLEEQATAGGGRAPSPLSPVPLRRSVSAGAASSVAAEIAAEPAAEPAPDIVAGTTDSSSELPPQSLVKIKLDWKKKPAKKAEAEPAAAPAADEQKI